MIKNKFHTKDRGAPKQLLYLLLLLIGHCLILDSWR